MALVGPPNSGKTTLYNQLTGLRQKVANYPGVTVEKHLGRIVLPGRDTVEIVDLPGVNGFSARTLDEKVTREVLEGRADGIRAPDALILVVDSTRLEPPTQDGAFNRRLIAEAAEWVFRPAMRAGEAISAWFPYRIIM